MCCVFVFFFKQKTAYEMRISDWSSDVCSSDLDVGKAVFVVQHFVEVGIRIAVFGRNEAETLRQGKAQLESSKIDVAAVGHKILRQPVVEIDRAHLSGDVRGLVEDRIGQRRHVAAMAALTERAVQVKSEEAVVAVLGHGR